MKRLAVVGLALALQGCVSVPGFHLPSLPAKAGPAPAAAPAQPVCSASVTADLKQPPPIPDGASVPAAQTPAASAGLAVYLAWLKAVGDWGRDGWARLAQAQQDCAPPV